MRVLTAALSEACEGLARTLRTWLDGERKAGKSFRSAERKSIEEAERGLGQRRVKSASSFPGN